MFQHKRIQLVVCIAFLLNTQAENIENTKTCQSGLREDNTNYIYCARQNLTQIPNLFKSTNSAQIGLNGISNVLYDELVLSDNLITRIESNAFSLSLKVKKLYLDLNPLRYIDRAAFEHVRNYLEEIYFEQKLAQNSNDQLSIQDTENTDSSKPEPDDLFIFEQSIFQTCFNLRLLSIKHYHLSKLSGLKLAKLSKIETLTLSNVKLRLISDEAFVGLEQSLVELNLDSNYLEWVPTGALERLKRLKRLSLSQNRIKHLHSNAFFRVSSTLNSLDLSYNYLAKIDENAFNGPIQNSLKSIQLQNNELKWPHFIHLLFNLHLLQDLNIDFNKLSASQQSLAGFGQYLAPSPLKLDSKSKNSSLIHLKLSSLSMQGNGLTEQNLNMFMNDYNYDSLINTDYFSSDLSSKELIGKQLQEPLIYLDNDLSGLGKKSSANKEKRFQFSNLNKLNLARNKLKQIANKYFDYLNMTQLRTLILDRNPMDITKFNENTFNGLENSLVNLNMNGVGFSLMSKNGIQSLNLLQNLQNLKLNANPNKIDSPLANGNTKLSIKSLVSLELQNNNLKELPEFLCNLENLVDLDLSSNRLANFNLNCLLFRLNNDYYEPSKLKQLNLNNNPLKCDCKMRQLKIWLMRNYDKDLLDLIKWKCVEPFELNGRYLTTIGLNDLNCVSSEPPTLIENNDSPVAVSTETTTRPTETTTQTTLVSSTQPATLEVSLNTTKIVELNELIPNGQAYENGFSQPERLPITNQKYFTTNSNSSEFSYYSLIVGISLTLSALFMIILFIFYILCIRNQEETKHYLSSILNCSKGSNSNKYEHKKICSPLSSSSSSSDSTTTSSMAYSKNKALDLTDVFSNYNFNTMTNSTNLSNCTSCQSNRLLIENETNQNFYNHLNNSNNFHIYHGYCEQKACNCASSSMQINNKVINKKASSTCLDYNSLNNDGLVFSVDAFKNANINEQHIYHEINTPIRTSNLNSNNKFQQLNQMQINQQCKHNILNSNNSQLESYENNLNYLIIPCQLNSNLAGYEHKVVNDFSNSLFV